MPRTKKGPSGPGKYSTRTDLPQHPPVGDSDLNYGDGKKIQEGRRAQSASSPPPSQNPQPNRAVARGGLDPSYIFGRETDRPGEAVQTGLPMGPGAGPEGLMNSVSTDKRELVLEYLVMTHDNQDVYDILQTLRAQKQQSMMGSYGGTQGALVGGGGGNAAAVPGGIGSGDPEVAAP